MANLIRLLSKTHRSRLNNDEGIIRNHNRREMWITKIEHSFKIRVFLKNFKKNFYQIGNFEIFFGDYVIEITEVSRTVD